MYVGFLSDSGAYAEQHREHLRVHAGRAEMHAPGGGFEGDEEERMGVKVRRRKGD